MLDDEHLLRAAIAGDRVALTAFVRETQADLWRYCTYFGSGGDVADLVQETYLKALSALPRFEARSSARSWLLGIARHVCADAVRRARRRRTLEGRSRPHGLPAADPADTVGLRLVLDTLTPDRREAFVLTQVIGLPYAEVAEVCGVPIGTVRSRVARAREDLQRELGADAG